MFPVRGHRVLEIERQYVRGGGEGLLHRRGAAAGGEEHAPDGLSCVDGSGGGCARPAGNDSGTAPRPRVDRPVEIFASSVLFAHYAPCWCPVWVVCVCTGSPGPHPAAASSAIQPQQSPPTPVRAAPRARTRFAAARWPGPSAWWLASRRVLGRAVGEGVIEVCPSLGYLRRGPKFFQPSKSKKPVSWCVVEWQAWVRNEGCPFHACMPLQQAFPTPPFCKGVTGPRQEVAAGSLNPTWPTSRSLSPHHHPASRF